MSQVQQVTVSVYSFNQLPKEAKKVVIQQNLESGYYDNSDHERADYQKSLNAFTSAFSNSFGYLLVGDVAKQSIVQSINRAVQIQAKENEFYAESINSEFNGKIESIADAIAVCQNCPFTGVCTDFYILDTIIAFLEGKDYQELTISQLLTKAKANGRNELQKQVRYYQSRKHVEESLKEYCEDLFFVDGSVIPEFLNMQQSA